MWFLQLKDDTQVEAKDVGPAEWISYWKPNITINLVDDFTRYFPTCSPQQKKEKKKKRNQQQRHLFDNI